MGDEVRHDAVDLVGHHDLVPVLPVDPDGVEDGHDAPLRLVLRRDAAGAAAAVRRTGRAKKPL